MSPRAKREYLEAPHRRYKNATRAQKSRILDEYCATCGQHRKHAIRPCLVPLLNELYRSEWRLFHNFFCPSVKLLEKERIGSKTRKRYDKPKTPYQRVMESTHIARKTKIRLTAQFRSLNPFVLREAMEIKLKKIFKACY